MRNQSGVGITLPGKGTWYKLIALLLVLALIVPLLAACDDDDDDDKTAMPTTSGAATTEPATIEPTQDTGPVKIGAVTSWSGSGAMIGVGFVDPLLGLLEDQIAEMGGILGGRDVEFIKYDDKSSVAGTVAGMTRFAAEDDVSLVLFGGAGATQIVAAAEEAENSEIPFFTMYSWFPDDLVLNYTTGVYNDEDTVREMLMEQVDKINPETIAYFGIEDWSTREFIRKNISEVEAKGIEVVYNEIFDVGLTDFSSYLTKIKHADPDVLMLMPMRPENATSIYKQIGELGGWGDIQVMSSNPLTASAAGVPACDGSIIWVPWVAGLQDPGAKAFDDAWLKKFGKAPPHNGLSMMYACAWTAIHAVELAGSTNRDDIIKAAHSGNLTWDTPAGPITVAPDGLGLYKGYLVQVRDGEQIPLD